jgi:hypothetical protein
VTTLLTTGVRPFWRAGENRFRDEDDLGFWIGDGSRTVTDFASPDGGAMKNTDDRDCLKQASATVRRTMLRNDITN